MHRISHFVARQAAVRLTAQLVSLSALTACANDTAKPGTPTGVPAAAQFARGGNGDNNGRILFTANDGVSPGYDIYSMNPDGSGVTRLTNSPANDVEPSLSSDGKRVAFSSNRDDPRGEIYVMNVDGTGVTRLTYSSAFDVTPIWSKDGKKIAFVSSRDAADPAADAEEILDVYVMNADGTGVTRLTHRQGVDKGPSWSADGKQIAFVSDRGKAGTTDVYTMNAADGSQVSRVTWVEEPEEMFVSWSPGGKQLAFSTTQVFVVNTDGTQLTQLTYAPLTEADFQPSWSPDAKQIAFTRFRDGRLHICTMSADGTQVSQLTYGTNNEFSPAWQR